MLFKQKSRTKTIYYYLIYINYFIKFYNVLYMYYMYVYSTTNRWVHLHHLMMIPWCVPIYVCTLESPNDFYKHNLHRLDILGWSFYVCKVCAFLANLCLGTLSLNFLFKSHNLSKLVIALASYYYMHILLDRLILYHVHISPNKLNKTSHSILLFLFY